VIVRAVQDAHPNREPRGDRPSRDRREVNCSRLGRSPRWADCQWTKAPLHALVGVHRLSMRRPCRATAFRRPRRSTKVHPQHVGRRRVCAACRTPLAQPSTGRPREYCSVPCRQNAWKRRRRQSAPAGVDRSQWWTPPELRERALALNVKLDVAALRESALVPYYLGPDHVDPARRDALSGEVDWAVLADGGRCWMNPPFDVPRLSRFLAKAVMTSSEGGVDVLGLLPASPCTRWWNRWVVDSGAVVEFVPGRLSFRGPHFREGGVAPWGAALVHWTART
jgi:hypothetical protein